MTRLPSHALRLLGVFALLLAGLVSVRAFVIPPALKDRTLHRKLTEERESSRPIRYAGVLACKECHEEEYARKVSGYHRNLSCEGCHGPLLPHTEEPMDHPASAPRGRDFCPVCHAYDAARPSGFPQINASLHNPLKPCAECHDPHDPKPPETPHECSACHAQIFKTKAVSPHAAIECTTCHETPEAHRVTPRIVRPTKPVDRAFCGGCHAKGAERKDAPKIDLETHEERYPCWQCHYPHMPEAR